MLLVFNQYWSILDKQKLGWGTTSRSFRSSKGLGVGDHFQVRKVSELHVLKGDVLMARELALAIAFA